MTVSRTRAHPQAQSGHAVLAAWGGGAELDPTEALMWRIGADPALRSVMCCVMLLDRAPDWLELQAGFRCLVDATPRLRQRVTRRMAGLYWVDDDNFDLSYHLRRVSLPAPADHRSLLDFAQTTSMSPIDESRAPWESVLVEGLYDKRAALIVKTHHVLADGIGFMQLLDAVLHPRPGRAHIERRSNPARMATPDHQGKKDAAFSTLASGRYLRSALRTLTRLPGPGSPIMRRRSRVWRFDTVEFPLARFKGAAKSAQASVNDILLAGLSGGLRQYHLEMGVGPRPIPVSIPVSLRSGPDQVGGNRFTGMLLTAPAELADPRERIRQLGARIRAMRDEPALDVHLRLMPLLQRLPDVALKSAFKQLTSAQDAQISNIPGLRRPAFVAGSRVLAMYPFGPLPGVAMMITMLSHDGHCAIGINSDGAAITDPELMRECIQGGLGEVLDLTTQAA